MDIRKPAALERIGCLLDNGLKIWYRQDKEKTPQGEWNIHAFMLMLRTKLMSTTAADKLWKQYQGFNMSQLGPEASISDYASQLEQFKLICKDKHGEQMISNHALKLKCIDSLRPDLTMPIRTQIDYHWDLAKIFKKATEIADILKSSHTKPRATK